jgi:hypothetical protein
MSYSANLNFPVSQFLAQSTTSSSMQPYPVAYLANTSPYLQGPAVFLGARTFLFSLNVMDRHAAQQTIQSMGTLADNWDGYGGASILPQITNAASSFLASLPEYVPAPDVSANPNGTISMEWENDAGRAHLEIGKTRYSLYFRRAEGTTLYRDGFVNEIDQPKTKLLSAMYPVDSPPAYTINLIRMAEAA